MWSGLSHDWSCVLNPSVRTTGDHRRRLILTLAGQLPSKNIIHVYLSSGSAKIKEVVYSVLELCEENKLSSVTFPALGTGLCRQPQSCRKERDWQMYMSETSLLIFAYAAALVWPSGKGGATPSAAADAMMEAMVDFVRKKQTKFVRSIKILIFQTDMITEFHRSMKKQEGAQAQEMDFHSYLNGIFLIS